MQAAPKPIILRERGGRRATRHCTQQDNGMLLRNEREEGGNTAARRAGRVKRGMILREEEEEEARELHDLTQMSVCTTYSQRTAWSDVCASLQADCLSLRGDEITGLVHLHAVRTADFLLRVSSNAALIYADDGRVWIRADL